MKRFHTWYRLAVAAVVITAGWQIGQGMYIHAKAMLAQELLEHAWLKTRQGEEEVKPWPWADTWPVARLSVPRLQISLIVLAGDTGRTLAFGPGHNFGSASPGAHGNSLISGHRDTHFRFLQYLQPGDAIFVEPPQGQPKVYQVDTTAIVDARQAWIETAWSSSRLFLITCYPFDAIVPGGRQRYVVSAVAVVPDTKSVPSESF